MPMASESPRALEASVCMQALLESLDADASSCCDLLLLDDVSDSDVAASDADAAGLHVLSPAESPPLFADVARTDSSPATGAEAEAGASLASSRPHVDLPRRRNSHREKVKQEIRFLRARAAELTTHVAALRTGRAALSDADRQRVDSWWKRLALNQQRERRESEAENARLKCALRAHDELSVSLQKALARRLDPAFAVAARRPKRLRVASMWEDSSIAELAGGLDAAFEHFDAAMEASGVTDAHVGFAPRCRMKVGVAPSGEAMPFIELTNTTVSPFSPRETAKAVWASLVEQHFHRRSSRVESAWRSGNTIAAHVRSKHALHSSSFGGDNREPAEKVLDFKIVLRKYIDDESRMVLVWRARNEGDGDLADVYADETGWALVQPAASAGESPCVARTCVHLVQRHRATQSVVDAAPCPSASALADLVVASNEDDFSAIVDAVERMLLAQARAGGASGVVGIK